jgi:hypothetical protein
MQQAGTRLSDPASKWYREALRGAKGMPSEKLEGIHEGTVGDNVKGTLA